MDRASRVGAAPRSGAAPSGPQPGGDVRPRDSWCSSWAWRSSPRCWRPTTRTTRTCCSGCRPPSAEHWLGTDDFGRDQLSRLIYGARVSLVAAGRSWWPSVAASATVLGMIAGYRGGRFDSVAGSGRRRDDGAARVPGGDHRARRPRPRPHQHDDRGRHPASPRCSSGSPRAATQDVREETYVEASRALGCTHPPHRAPPRAPQRDRARGRADRHPLRRRDHRRGQPQLHRPGRATTHVHLGLDVVDGQLLHEPGATPDVRPGCDDRHHRAGVLAPRRRSGPGAGHQPQRGAGRSSCVALLQVDNLTVSFSSKAGWVNAVEGASFEIEPGQTVGLVGESGSGKTVTALADPRPGPGDKVAASPAMPTSRVATSSASRRRELADVRGARVSHDLPAGDPLARPRVHRRRADRRDGPPPPGRRRARTRGSAAVEMLDRVQHPARGKPARRSTRTRSAAACASGS